jgi:DNA-binding GntR family transcriptional regulator
VQVAESLRHKITEGVFTEQLPSIAQLTEQYNVSRSTIERALTALRNDGAIESVKGAGWYVAGTGDRRPLVTRVTELLRAQGTKEGDAFPTEKELCEKFGVSRTAVRSALAQLEGQGIISKHPARGRVVSSLPVQSDGASK